jgi:hypothetical protein
MLAGRWGEKGWSEDRNENDDDDDDDDDRNSYERVRRVWYLGGSSLVCVRVSVRKRARGPVERSEVERRVEGRNEDKMVRAWANK